MYRKVRSEKGRTFFIVWDMLTKSAKHDIMAI